MFSKISGKGFRKTSVPLAFHTSLRSVEKPREKKYIYIYCSIRRAREDTLSHFESEFLFHEEIVLPYNGIFSILIMVYTNFFPPPRLFSFIGNTWPSSANILYNEQLESNGFFYKFFLSLIFVLIFLNNFHWTMYQNYLIKTFYCKKFKL